MTRLSDRVTLVRAPNPGPMTLEGTNTYVVGDDRAVLVIDPGPADAGHLAAVRAAVDTRSVAAILLTHRHRDHAEGARMFADALDAQVYASTGPDDVVDVPISEGGKVGSGSVFMDVMHTPGHASDHLCFVLSEENAVFSGDHVLGRGTSVIVWPDGDLTSYLHGLDRLIALAPARIFPGHGPIIDDPAPVLAFYKQHRLDREKQIVAALAAGASTVDGIVAAVYVDVDPSLHRVAALSVQAHLVKLETERRALQNDGIWTPASTG